MTDHPVPSDHARALVVGAYDTHVHIAPDVMPRLIDDVSLAKRFAAVGMAGFVLKSHYVPTAERAEVVRGVVPGVDVLGAVTLNGSMGGFNPVAVEIAGRQGAKIIWLPTVDSLNQRESRAEMPEGATPPMWAQLQDDLAAKGIMAPAIAVLDDNGGVLPEVREVLERDRGARHGARHRASQPARDRRGGRSGLRRRHPPHHRHASGVHLPTAAGRRSAAPRRTRRTARAVLHHAATPARCRGRNCSTTFARSARSTRSCRAILANRSTRRSRTVWPCWPTGSSEPASPMRRSTLWQYSTRVE